MLPIEYQNHVRAILLVSAAQIKATGKFKSGAVKRHPRVKAAAAVSAVVSRAGAPYKKNQIEALARGDIENQCFKYIRQLHKYLKDQGLAFLPAGTAAVLPVVALASPKIIRRDVLTGVAAATILGAGLLMPSSADAHHDRNWLAAKPFLGPFIASMRDEIVAIITD